MNKILSLLAILFTVFVSAQVPQGVSYQAIALNGSGNPVASSNVGIRLSVLDNSVSGTVLYTETHVKTTNPQGLFNLVIGQGTPTTGTFATINWALNSKYLKVEMDVAGGTNYIIVGTTQLLSVPYALASKSLTLGAGEGIVLTSPNGTQYTVGVNDAGQLSLPSTGVTGTFPSTLFLYGTFNSYNPTTALQFSPFGSGSFFAFSGYKYLTAGTEIKYLSTNNASAAIYGMNVLNVVLNGNPFIIPANGFYYININNLFSGANVILDIESISPVVNLSASSNVELFPTYNVGTNTFSFIATGVVSGNTFTVEYPSQNGSFFGDNLADGTLEFNGAAISFPGASATPKNYRIDMIINFNGAATYTITQI